MFSIKNITVLCNNTRLFHNFGITIFPSTVICIYGPNGSGKTTLINTLCGLKEIKEGVIEYNECNIKEAISEYHSLIAYQSHQIALDDNLTVRENLLFYAKIHNMHHGLVSAMHYFKLDQYSDYKIYQLSEGWKRRVALSRLLLTHAIIWFLDEPFTNLDKEGVFLLKELIQTRLSQMGIIILTSHTKEEDFINLNLQDFK